MRDPTMAAVRDFPTIKAIRSYIIGGVGSGTSLATAALKLKYIG